MTPERWHAVRELFEEALTLPVEQRQSWVDERCGQDQELRHAVEALLDSDDRAGSFLADLVAAPMDPPADEGQDGEVVGSYRLLRKLGEGGMGSVFVAVKDDRSVTRQVAVKLIRSGMESAQNRRRLQAEGRILATLEHPNIARLYDSGTTPGHTEGEELPYFVMELIDGLPIDAHCDSHRLPISERLRLFRKVCGAVHYAHQHLIVHRDLKPNNILVTAQGEPKLLDFGIAKLLEDEPGTADAAPTVPWGRWLTPDYASPEQILGHPVTTACDVYALGVLLSKLLVGVLPRSFGSMSAVEVESALRDHSPDPPSALLGTLPAASDSTVSASSAQPSNLSQRAISEARGTRPPQLRQQLEGDLDTIVLEALNSDPQHRYASAERLSEDLLRHQRGLPILARPDDALYRLKKYVRRHRLAVATAAAFVVLLVGGSLALAVESAKVTRERDQLRAVVAFVKEVFKVAAEGEELTVRQAVDRSAAILERKLDQQPEVRATLMDTAGTVYLNLWAIDQAKAQLAQAVEIRSQLHGDRSPAVAESLSSLGLALAFQGDLEAGESKARQALSVFRHRYGARHPELVRPLNNLVNLLCYKNDFTSAEEPSSEALALAQELLPEEREEVAQAAGNRALVLTKTDRLPEAIELYREALRLHRRYVGDEHPAVAEILNNLALVLKRQERFDEAEELYRQAIEIEGTLFGEDSSKLSVTLNNLASLLLARDDLTAAIATYGQARDLALRSLGPDHPGTLITSVGLALARIAGGEPEAAEELLESGREGWRERLGKSWLFAYAESVLGESLTAQGRYREAEGLVVASYPKIRQAQGDNSSKTRDAHQRIIALYRAWDRPDKLAEILAETPTPTTPP